MSRKNLTGLKFSGKIGDTQIRESAAIRRSESAEIDPCEGNLSIVLGK